jgi:hypothetical protein
VTASFYTPKKWATVIQQEMIPVFGVLVSFAKLSTARVIFLYNAKDTLLLISQKDWLHETFSSGIADIPGDIFIQYLFRSTPEGTSVTRCR